MRFFKSKPAVTLEETSSKIDEKISEIDEKVNNCNVELARIKQSITTNASAGTLKIAKQKATEILRRRKAYEAQKQQLTAAQININRSEHSAFQVRTAIDVQNALKSTLKVMKKDLRKVNLNKIEKLQDDMEDMQDHAYEISDALGKQYENQDDVNEDDLEFEFSMISQSALEGSESADVMSGFDQTPSCIKGVKMPSTPINEPGRDYKATLEE